LGKKDSVFWVEWSGVLVFLLYWMTKSVELRFTQLETPEKFSQVVAMQQRGYVQGAV
jgi:hypothetical protein